MVQQLERRVGIGQAGIVRQAGDGVEVVRHQEEFFGGILRDRAGMAGHPQADVGDAVADPCRPPAEFRRRRGSRS